MSTSLITAALSLLLLTSSASPVSKKTALQARQAPSELKSTDNYLSVVSTKASGRSKRLSAAWHRPGHEYTNVQLSDLLVEEEWAAEIVFGNETVLVILDTGSSDTWLAQKGFQCVDINGTDIAEAECSFGPLYNATFEEGTISNENFNITYGDGEFLTGTEGYSDVSIGSIKVKHQQVALVNKAYWNGDGSTSGLMGLAYSAITSAFEGTDPTKDNANVTGTAAGDQVLYSPVVQSMIAQGLNPPLFTLALERSSDTSSNIPGGYIAFGGLPPVSVNPRSFVHTPILIHEFYAYPPVTAVDRSFYTIKPDGYVYDNSKGVATSHTTPYDAIVDSGTTLLYVPTPVADGYLASFNPPATLYEGDYFYPCDATAPYFGITIAGTIFNISSADIILPDSGYTNSTSGVDYCLIGVIDGGNGIDAMPIFGDVFLKNVVAVFDVGASLLAFAQHDY